MSNDNRRTSRASRHIAWLSVSCGLLFSYTPKASAQGAMLKGPAPRPATLLRSLSIEGRVSAGPYIPLAEHSEVGSLGAGVAVSLGGYPNASPVGFFVGFRLIEILGTSEFIDRDPASFGDGYSRRTQTGAKIAGLGLHFDPWAKGFRPTISTEVAAQHMRIRTTVSPPGAEQVQASATQSSLFAALIMRLALHFPVSKYYLELAGEYHYLPRARHGSLELTPAGGVATRWINYEGAALLFTLGISMKVSALDVVD